MNYKVVDDGMFTSIFKTDEEEPNELNVFETLPKAKKQAIEDLKSQIADLQYTIRKIRKLKDDELELD